MIRFAVLILILIGASVNAAELQVSAPKSLKGAFMEITEVFERKNPEWKVKLRVGRSSELGRIIAQGAGTDVFLLSDEKTVRDLKQKKRIQNVRRFLADDLVVIGAETSKLDVSEPAKLAFPELKGVALFGEKHPVGKTARAYLKKINLLDSILAKVALKKNTKEVLTSISSGETDWGIVYASDIVNAKGIKVLWKIPEKDIIAETYYVGSVTKSQHQEGARLFIETLNSTIAEKIFQNAGLRLLKN